MSQVIRGYGNKICVHEGLMHPIPHIFLVGLERLNVYYRRYCFTSRNRQAISDSTKPLHDPGKLKSPCLSMVGEARSAYLHSFYSYGWIYSFGSCLKHLIKRKHILSKKLKKAFRTQRPFNSRNPTWAVQQIFLKNPHLTDILVSDTQIWFQS